MSAKKKNKNKKKEEPIINQLKRLQADFDNYKKRVEKEKKLTANNAKAELVKEIIPSIVSFEKAFPLINDDGVKLIYKELLKVLKNQGLKRIKSEGEKFNINLHEAVMSVESKEDEGLIMEEVEPGFVFNGKVIRHSKVIVNKKK